MSQDPGAASTASGGLQRRIEAKLRAARRVLLLGVGGGNDSVTTLLARNQLAHDFGLDPERTAIGAMLPDILDYHEVAPAAAPRVWRVLPESRRSLQGLSIRAFPEPLLAREKARFGIDELLGIWLSAGSEGVCESLRELVRVEDFDLVLACDVGGDFIAAPENRHVLSPMMDGYALHALRRLAEAAPGGRGSGRAAPEIVYCVFGLGTDGESTPELLRSALRDVGEWVMGAFDPALTDEVASFYRTVIEPNRHSFTCDLTLRTIRGEPLREGGLRHRARFHTRPEKERRRSYLAAFPFTLDPEFAGRYYLFDDPRGIRNPFAFPCRSGIEWFLKTQRFAPRIDHELNGQVCPDVNAALELPAADEPRSLYFGTPSWRFTEKDRREIARDTLESVRNGVYDCALVYAADLEGLDLGCLEAAPMPCGLTLLAPVVDRGLIAALQVLAA